MNAFARDSLSEGARRHAAILELRGNASQPKKQTTRKIAIHSQMRPTLNLLDLRRFLWLPFISTPHPL
jgi:hypothetical protein